MNESLKILRQQSWDYYAMHSSQRMTTANFYIAISTALAGGMVITMQPNQSELLGVILGFLLVFVTFIFWQWDKRNSDLIKMSELSLRQFEDELLPHDKSTAPPVMKLFTYEEFTTNEFKRQQNYWRGRIYFTYRKCLNLLFLCFGVVGIVGIVIGFLV